MPNYLSPGVYVHEVEAGTRPIEGVGTAVAAFVGLASKGPDNEPTLVYNWTQFSENFGDFVPGSYLAHAVYGYFLNGGGNCYVVRIGADGSDGIGANGDHSGNGAKTTKPAAKSVTSLPFADVGGLRVTAKAAAANSKPVTV